MTNKRAEKRFGRFLTPRTELIDKEVRSSPSDALKFIEPTLTFDDVLTLDIAGNYLNPLFIHFKSLCTWTILTFITDFVIADNTIPEIFHSVNEFTLNMWI